MSSNHGEARALIDASLWQTGPRDDTDKYGIDGQRIGDLRASALTSIHRSSTSLIRRCSHFLLGFQVRGATKQWRLPPPGTLHLVT